MKKHFILSVLLLSVAVGMVSCYSHRDADSVISSSASANSTDTQQDKVIASDTVKDFEQLLT